MTDGFDITNEEGDFIHINYVTSEDGNKPGNGEEIYCDENEWVWVRESTNSKPDAQLDSQECISEYKDKSSENSNNEHSFDASFYELVTESLKANSDELVIEDKPALSTSEIEAEVLYLPEEPLRNIMPCANENDKYYGDLNFVNYGPKIKEGNNNEFDCDDDIDFEEYRFIHEYNEEVDMCAKTKAHSDLLDIYPNNFMGLDSKNDLLGGRSRKRRCKKMDLNKKTEYGSRFYSFNIDKDSLWVYKNA